MATLTVSEARAALPEVLNRVEDGEEITITRHGRVVAVIVRPDTLRSRRAERLLAEADEIHQLLADARTKPLTGSGGIPADRAEELVADVRAGRQAR
ncbi:MAG TPA: type II toxin-antitoxin system Phd/YefM family antitoxin [Micromonosporaceae bacterium]|nr:type II toxin-antitoxin system Phd/YefM family antitoxin [Micromonosporaceae bacterium]